METELYTINEEIACRQLCIIKECIYNIALYRGLSSIMNIPDLQERLKNALDNINNIYEFVVTSMNNGVYTICIRWCNLFGTDNEENHWKKLFSNISKQNEIRKDIFHKICKNKESWIQYCKTFKDFRDNYVAHLNDYGYNCNVPNFDQAIEIFYLFYEKICTALNLDSYDDIKFYYENSFKEVLAVYNNLILSLQP